MAGVDASDSSDGGSGGNGGWHSATAPSGAVKVTTSLVSVIAREGFAAPAPCRAANEAIQPG